jgi:hypothetical protein
MTRILIAAVVMAFAAAVQAENIVFPEDSGHVDVKLKYGAKGDGATDDTEALKKAFEELKGKNTPMYFPNGTYLISDSVGLFGAKAHSPSRFINIQGQSEAGVVIKLKDKSPGFGDASKPKVVVSTYDGASTGDAMHTYVRNITVDVGAGNPGAAGLRFMSNNTGAAYNITVRSSDPAGAGAVGFDLRQSQNGPALCKNITVIGFDHGIETGNTFSLVLENITVKGFSKVGFKVNNSRITIRKLKTTGKGPAVDCGPHAQLTLIEGDFVSDGKDAAAVVLAGDKVFLRDVKQTGYASMVKTAAATVPGEKFDEWHPLPGYSLFGAEPKTLRLPIEEAPEIPWETDFSKWVKVEAGEDKLQAAVDAAASAGKTTVYFPKAGKENKYVITKPVRVYGSVNRIIGMENILWIDGRLPVGETVFVFEDLKGPLVLERFFNILMNGGWKGLKDRFLMENKSDQPIILRNFAHGACTLKKPNPGKTLFIEDVAGRLEIGKGERCWARQINPESPDLDMVTVDGGTCWILGLKTEGRAKHIVATGGAKVELLGGVSYQSWKNKQLDPPAFDITDSQVSLTFGFYHFSLPFTTIVEEKLDGKKLEIPRTGLKGYHLPIYRSGGKN